MELAEALRECMKEANLRDEDVAVRVGISAQSVSRYRKGQKLPSQPNYDRLRREIPGFADRMDGKKAVA